MQRRGEKINIVGVENWGNPPFPQYGDLDKALEGVDSDAFSICNTNIQNLLASESVFMGQSSPLSSSGFVKSVKHMMVHWPVAGST